MKSHQSYSAKADKLKPDLLFSQHVLDFHECYVHEQMNTARPQRAFGIDGLFLDG